ncbi:hypothetical protein C8035_v001890 [Colletotrichum spinosum]|uniref:Uncharacterized protein n=1 Tax=Colletotrichum spinosum TaxID=1347390 RepID=A0A4R8Q612_9PEZI|nr:hypothetical protein C8035_v001890 [Colletotrichum spinosum]
MFGYEMNPPQSGSANDDGDPGPGPSPSSADRFGEISPASNDFLPFAVWSPARDVWITGCPVARLLPLRGVFVGTAAEDEQYVRVVRVIMSIRGVVGTLSECWLLRRVGPVSS